MIDRCSIISTHMAKFKKRLEARSYRKKGRSIRSISEELGVSKGSVSIWCSDLKLTEKQEKRLMESAIRAGHKGRIIGAETNRRKKIETVQKYKELAFKQLGRLSNRDLLVAGVALYWGEGTKSDKYQLAFVNSDPEAIRFMCAWFHKIMGVQKSDFMPRIFINEMHKPRIGKVLGFWTDFLGFPKEQFGKPVFIKRKQRKVYENYQNYYGILSLKIRKSAHLKYHTLGFVDALRDKAQNIQTPA
jgi:hypothetical protein